MKKLKFFAVVLGLSFGLTALGVNAWNGQAYGIIFENWGTQTINTAYVTKSTVQSQTWETWDISNGGNPEVVLQDQTAGTITDGPRIYLYPDTSYTWQTDLSKVAGHNYRLQFKKNGWTLGMTEVTGYWWKY